MGGLEGERGEGPDMKNVETVVFEAPLCRNKLHPLTKDNLLVTERGGSRCIACFEASGRRWRATKRLQALQGRIDNATGAKRRTLQFEFDTLADSFHATFGNQHMQALQTRIGKTILAVPSTTLSKAYHINFEESPPTDSEQDAFMAMVEQAEGSTCWLWTGPLTTPRLRKDGTYSNTPPAPVKFRNITVSVRWLSYRLFVGLVAVPFWFRVSCNNAACVNPEHLVLYNTAPPGASGPPGGYSLQAKKRKKQTSRKGRHHRRCRNGHELNDDTVRITVSGQRVCIKCEQARAGAKGLLDVTRQRDIRQDRRRNWATIATNYLESL